MINEERIKLMTRMTMLEQKTGKEWMKIGGYYKWDYISFHMLKTFLATTTAFFMILGLIALYQMDWLMKNLHKVELISVGKLALVCFVCYGIIFQIIAYGVYATRYHNARKNLKIMKENIDQLSEMYKTEASENIE